MTAFEPKRPQRVAELLHHELARLLASDLKDPRVGFATITEVRLAADLKNARVYVSVYGSEEERAASLAALQAATGFLRREVGHRLRLKYTPELLFARDDSLDRAERLDALFGAIAHGEIETPADAPVPVVPVETDRSALADSARSFEEPLNGASKKTKSRRRRG